ncbi:DEAD/DEAH box helicase [Streptomyces sioyaensis]|uniref:DEAD/DEAH box helicase n=1 Tax=Streptomyces sioyaensis TaxID=67364 RepID=A0A4Q1QRA6_9ACTN|nr:DEAD/DEAH box helicase [Streptomyces sioyaensis]MBM4795037.1 DEAD/DEAH box helicase [Streptomyces sioyaensis]RXS58946.1 DEAD/DEAH box helicase [Streptomyces sioyaensis]
MPETGSGVTLHLGFDTSHTKVVLRTTQEHRSELVQLAARFRSGGQLGPLAVIVEIDDLLSQLSAVGSWSDPQGVSWDPELRHLVVSSVQDAETVRKELEAPGAQQRLAASDVAGLLGSNWTAPLTEFQQRDIAKLLSLRHGANFSVPGAGKTRVGLAVYSAMKEHGEVGRLMVVSPKSAYESWLYESGACFRSRPRPMLLESARDQWAEILIVNYERLDRSLPFLAAWLQDAPSMIILDEAHRMKLGSRGTYGAACMTLGPLARRRLILTGTPAPNGAKDLENLLGFVWPGYGQRSVAQAVADGDLAHASSALRPLFTRTTKHELELPPLEPVMVPVEMSPLHGEIYQALVGDMSARAEPSADNFATLGKSALRLLMAATNPALLLEGSSKHEPVEYRFPPLEIPQDDSLYELLKELPSYELAPKYTEAARIVAANAAQGRKTLVWSTFVRSLTSLGRLLENFEPAVVHGGTPDREEQLRRFREDPDCMVLVSNPATLGEGISLHQVCHDAVYVDRDFMAGRYLQSLDRIHRLGLDPGVETRVTVLAAQETVDEVVAVRLQQKLDFMARVLDDPSVQQLADLQEAPPMAGGLDAQDIRAMLKHIGRG